MKHCSLCRLEVDTNQEYCPLCYNHLTEISKKETPEMFNLEKPSARQKKRSIVAKVFLLITLTLLAACVFINIETKTTPWSVVVVLSVLYLWVLVAHTIMSRSTPFKKVLFQLVSIIALLVATNKIFSNNDWLTHYVYPALAMFATCVLSMIICCSKHRKKLYFSFFSIFTMLLVASLIFVCFKIDTFRILNLINVLFQGVIMIALMLFAGRSLLTEASRKFHI